MISDLLMNKLPDLLIDYRATGPIICNAPTPALARFVAIENLPTREVVNFTRVYCSSENASS